MHEKYLSSLPSNALRGRERYQRRGLNASCYFSSLIASIRDVSKRLYSDLAAHDCDCQVLVNCELLANSFNWAFFQCIRL
jgi:hypothetical protein